MKNNLVGLSVGIVCVLVLIGTLLVPMVDSVTAETLTYTNEGMPYAAVDDDTHTITVTSSEITVDGTVLDTSALSSYSSYTIIYAESEIIRDSVSVRIEVRNGYTQTWQNFPYSSGETVTMEITGDSVTISSTDTSISAYTVSDVMYYISYEGDYVLASNPVINSDSIMYGAGSTYYSASVVPSATTIYVIWSGTMDDISGTLPITTTSKYTYALGGITANVTDLGNGLYYVDSVVINFDVTYTDSDTSETTDYDLTATYTYFLAPYEVVYDNPDYIGDTESVLLSVIPLFTILAVLCAVTYAVMRNRD